MGFGLNSRVGRQANAGDRANGIEELADAVLVDIEGKVTNEEGVALGADGVTVSLGAVRSTGLGVGIGGLGVGVVEVDGTAINLLALHGLVRLGAGVRVVEVDVAEATAAARHLVGDDTGVDEALELLESLVQSVVINAPAQATGEQGRGGISLGLLGSLVDLSLGLALLGSAGGLSGLGIGDSLVRILLGVVAVLGVILGIIRLSLLNSS